MHRDKERVRTVRNHLREVERLLRGWDPIGVILDPEDPDGPLDEYDSYAPAILGKLQAECDVQAIANHLNELATTRMGLRGNIEHDLMHAEKLVGWWRASKSVAA